MRATVLIDNISNNDLIPEWGLSIYIEYKDKKILLDTGASPAFAQNAKKLQIDLREVDFGVLSHAHYDHSNGMETFFKENEKAVFYLRQGCKENCYRKNKILYKYIGIQKGVMKKYHPRIVLAEGDYEIAPGISLIPHKCTGLEEIGKKNGLYVWRTCLPKGDDFSHEQSLVFDTDKGLVIFNSCSHGGADRIIEEIKETYPGKGIYALIGGLHLYHMTDGEVRTLAGRIAETGIQKVYTGHCSKEKGYNLLKEELGDMVVQFKTGLVIEL